MNGPDHYLAANSIVAHLTKDYADTGTGDLQLLAIAQIHATLALTAATAQQLADRYRGDGDHINAWADTWQEHTR